MLSTNPMFMCPLCANEVGLTNRGPTNAETLVALNSDGGNPGVSFTLITPEPTTCMEVLPLACGPDEGPGLQSASYLITFSSGLPPVAAESFFESDFEFAYSSVNTDGDLCDPFQRAIDIEPPDMAVACVFNAMCMYDYFYLPLITLRQVSLSNTLPIVFVSLQLLVHSVVTSAFRALVLVSPS